MRRVVLTQGPRVRRGLLMTLVVVMPLIFLVDVLNDPVNTPKLAFLIAIVSLTLAVRAVEFACGRSGDGSGGLLVPALAVVLPLGIAWLLSPYRGWALLGQYNRYQGFLPYLVLAAFGLLAAEAFRGRALTLAWALLIAGAAAGAYALLETFGLSPFIWNAGGGAKTLGLTQASSTLGNPNFAGGFMCVVVPVGVGVWLTDRERRDRASVCLALTVVGWLVSFSQGAWLAGAAGLAVTLGIVLAPRLPWARVAGFAIAALLAVAGVGVVIAAMVGGPHDGDRTTADVRAWAWEAAIDMTADHPVVGRGPNSFAVEGIQHRTKDEGIQADYQTDDPHSVFFSYLTAAGVLGGLGFVILAGWIIRRALTVGSEAPLAAAFAGAAVAYLAQSLLSFDELSTRLALWTALAGLAATLPRHLDATIGSRVPAPRADDDHGPPTLSRVVALLAAAVVLVSGCWYAGTIMVADRHYLRGVRAAQDNLAEEAVDAFDAAIAVRPDHYYRANAGNRIGELGARRDAEGEPYIEKMREELSFLAYFPQITAIETEADLLHAWAAKADPSAEEEALALYERAMSIDKWNPILRAKAADSYIELGREADALARLLPLAGENVPFARYWGTLAFVHARLGDEAEAEEAATKAFAIDPRDPRALQAVDLLSAVPRA